MRGHQVMLYLFKGLAEFIWLKPNPKRQQLTGDLL